MADVLFVIYILFVVAVCIFAFHPRGIKLQQELYAEYQTQTFLKHNK